MQSLWEFLLSSYLIQIPAFAIWLVGILIAVARWKQHPRVSQFMIMALVIFLLRALLIPLVQFWLHTRGGGLAGMGIQLSILNIASAFVGALAWSLILAAVFGWRKGRVV